MSCQLCERMEYCRCETSMVRMWFVTGTATAFNYARLLRQMQRGFCYFVG